MDAMNEQQAREFQKWHEEQKAAQVVFNNREELIKYCCDDVRLLREGCVKFMLDFVDLLQVNPFLQTFTIAQAVMCVYRKLFMKKDSLAIIPRNNYRTNKQQSFIGRKWLIYENEKVNGKIKEEYKLKEGLLVDGFLEENNTVYEFQVCIALKKNLFNFFELNE